VSKRLPRALLRETAGLYPIGVGAICLLLSIDQLSVLARFLIEQGAAVQDVLLLLLYRLPWFLHLALPVGVVFAVLLTGGRWAKDSELKAAYALGVPPRTLLTPLVLFGLLVGALSLLNNGFLEPKGEAAYQRRIDAFVYARPPAALQLNAAYQIGGDIFFASRVRSVDGSPGRANLEGVLVLLRDGTLTTASTGTWDSDVRTWTLERAQTSAPGEAPIPAERLVFPFPLEAAPADTLVRPAQLPLGRVVEQLRTVRAAGGDVGALTFSLHRRLADAFSAAIFATFAGAIALRVRGRAAGFAWTIVLLVGFWALWVLSGNLFDSGAVQALVAAWLTPGLAGLGAALLAWRTLST
jgi:lipopolysaccharide export system permease protein